MHGQPEEARVPAVTCRLGHGREQARPEPASPRAARHPDVGHEDAGSAPHGREDRREKREPGKAAVALGHERMGAGGRSEEPVAQVPAGRPVGIADLLREGGEPRVQGGDVPFLGRSDGEDCHGSDGGAVRALQAEHLPGLGGRRRLPPQILDDPAYLGDLIGVLFGKLTAGDHQAVLETDPHVPAHRR